MIQFIKNYKLTIIGTLVGLIGGFAYYKLIGCNSGTCAITSNPINSTIYGFFMGGLLFNMIEIQIKNYKKDGK